MVEVVATDVVVVATAVVVGTPVVDVVVAGAVVGVVAVVDADSIDDDSLEPHAVTVTTTNAPISARRLTSRTDTSTVVLPTWARQNHPGSGDRPHSID